LEPHRPEELKAVPFPELREDIMSPKKLSAGAVSSRFVRAEPQSPKTVSNHKTLPDSPFTPSKFFAEPLTAIGNETPISPTLKKKRGWGDWSDIGFASSDDSGASDKDISPLRKSGGIAPLPSPVQQLEVVQEDLVTSKETLEDQLKLRRSFSMPVQDSTHRRAPSLPSERVIESSTKERPTSESLQPKKLVFSETTTKDPPKFGSGRGAILRRPTTPESLKTKPMVEPDTEFIKHMEAERAAVIVEKDDSKEEKLLEDVLPTQPTIVVEAAPKVKEIVQQHDSKIIEPESDESDEEESEPKKRLTRKSKMPSKLPKLTKKSKSLSRHKGKVKREEESSFGSDYIFIFVGIAVAVVLIYLYQTQYLTTV